MTSHHPSEPETQFIIRPTSLWDGAPHHSDVALTSVFAVHAAQIASERAAIWQRYSALLVAQSIMVTALTRTANGACAIVLSIFGMVFCWYWYELTDAGWRLFRNQLDEARRFTWAERNVNPIAFVLDVHMKKADDESAHAKRDRIKRAAIGVIVIFAALHGSALIGGVLVLAEIIKPPFN